MATLSPLPQDIYDIYHRFGNDLVFSSNGDLAVVTGLPRGEQRILRRLLTNPLGYIWHADYGAGISASIGLALSATFYEEMKSLIQSQIFLESCVSQNPPPEILLQTIQTGLYCQINYTDNPTKTPAVINFDVSA